MKLLGPKDFDKLSKTAVFNPEKVLVVYAIFNEQKNINTNRKCAVNLTKKTLTNYQVQQFAVRRNLLFR